MGIFNDLSIIFFNNIELWVNGFPSFFSDQILIDPTFILKIVEGRKAKNLKHPTARALVKRIEAYMKHHRDVIFAFHFKK